MNTSSPRWRRKGLDYEGIFDGVPCLVVVFRYSPHETEYELFVGSEVDGRTYGYLPTDDDMRHEIEAYRLREAVRERRKQEQQP